MFKKILLVLSLFIALLALYAAFQSPKMRIERELKIAASSEKLFPYINNNQKMNEWMPWIDSDPGVKMTYSGPTEGIGSKANWDSKGKMGTGESEIIEVQQNQFVKTKLTYTKPMEMNQIAMVTLNSISPTETLVKWSVDGHNSFMFRFFGIFMNIDKMVGGEFEKGLAKLKQMAESN